MLRTHGIGPLTLVVCLVTATVFAACKDDKPATPPAAASATATAKATGLSAAPATSGAAAPTAAKGKDLGADKLGAFKPLPKAMESKDGSLTGAKVDLGRMLYFETRLSKNQDLSCDSCHDLGAYGVDGKDVSTGHKGQKGGRNSPTVYNAAGQFVQFWDGRAADVEAQAKGPILNPVEMAMADEAHVVAVLTSIPAYVDAFKKAFPEAKDAVTYDNLAKAIGAFERKLVTPSRWDKYLEGDKSALTDDEKAGFEAFLEAGCAACHNGAYVGGAMYQKTGVVRPWPNQKDQGRFEVTKADVDKLVFKVPTLRNVEKTAPYFHDASAKTLEEAVKAMAAHQVGKDLKDGEVRSIVAWLKTLTGDLPTAYVAKPKLPASTPTTPKADPK